MGKTAEISLDRKVGVPGGRNEVSVLRILCARHWQNCRSQFREKSGSILGKRHVFSEYFGSVNGLTTLSFEVGCIVI